MTLSIVRQRLFAMILRHIPKNMLLLFLGDALIIVGAFVAANGIWFGAESCEKLASPWSGGAFLAVFVIVFYMIDLYEFDLRFWSARYLFRHLAGVSLAAILLAISFFFVPDVKSGRGVFVISFGLVGAGTFLWRGALEATLNGRLRKKKRLLIVGAGRAGRMLFESLKNNPEYQVLGFMIDDDPAKWSPGHVPAVMGGSGSLREVAAANRVNIIVLAISKFHDPQLLKSALNCKLDGVQVHDMPSFYESATGKVPVEHVTDFWLVFAPLRGVKKSVYNQKLKRVLDIILSFLGLVLTAPLMLLVAAAIRLDSPGPVFYRQKRVGLHGEVFTLKKFRSMKVGTDSDRRFAGEKNDPRITRIGKIIRLSRIDEIPQMWNVLGGDMSFIGPRALIEEEVHEFETKVPYFCLRHSVRPGITGWAQVNYKHGARVEDALEKLQYDLFYVKNLSPLLDFHILLRTVKVVLFGKGAR